jgi:HKD family nuclease
VELILHPATVRSLADRYRHALAHAVELLIVNAYLTEWNVSLELNPNCRHFRMVIGKDFGITRKFACAEVMRWLPSRLKAHFRVADQIGSFHPKAVFWKEVNGDAFAIVGSSNLTAAAFANNYEANIFCPLSPDDYRAAKDWVKRIVAQSVTVSQDWLDKYREAPLQGRHGSQNHGGAQSGGVVVPITLPSPKGTQHIIADRRGLLAEYEQNRSGLMRLFQDCADGRITSPEFYDTLPQHWGGTVGGRLQGAGFEIKGKHSDFRALSNSFLKIVNAADDDRDDVAIEEIDRLAEEKIPTRSALLSEMLCLRFPQLFPVVNKPVKNYLRHIKFRPPSGASKGAIYLDLAQKLRVSLGQNRDYPAKSLAELDAIIWHRFQD